jgi:precorrin-6A/cobalt-precorrin-6A reductase
VPGPGDSWTFLNTIEDASNNIPAGSTVYATTGRRELAALRALDDCIVHCRIRNTTDAEFPLAKGRFVRRLNALPVEVEAANFAEWGVDWVVARNTGSGASSTELEVARRLALPVAMIRRPKQPDALRIETISEALLWIRRRV